MKEYKGKVLNYQDVCNKLLDLQQRIYKAIEYIKINIYENVNEVKVVNANELLKILGDKENEKKI